MEHHWVYFYDMGFPGSFRICLDCFRVEHLVRREWQQLFSMDECSARYFIEKIRNNQHVSETHEVDSGTENTAGGHISTAVPEFKREE